MHHTPRRSVAAAVPDDFKPDDGDVIIEQEYENAVVEVLADRAQRNTVAVPGSEGLADHAQRSIADVPGSQRSVVAEANDIRDIRGEANSIIFSPNYSDAAVEREYEGHDENGAVFDYDDVIAGDSTDHAPRSIAVVPDESMPDDGDAIVEHECEVVVPDESMPDDGDAIVRHECEDRDNDCVVSVSGKNVKHDAVIVHMSTNSFKTADLSKQPRATLRVLKLTTLRINTIEASVMETYCEPRPSEANMFLVDQSHGTLADDCTKGCQGNLF